MGAKTAAVHVRHSHCWPGAALTIIVWCSVRGPPRAHTHNVTIPPHSWCACCHPCHCTFGHRWQAYSRRWWPPSTLCDQRESSSECVAELWKPLGAFSTHVHSIGASQGRTQHRIVNNHTMVTLCWSSNAGTLPTSPNLRFLPCGTWTHRTKFGSNDVFDEHHISTEPSQPQAGATHLCSTAQRSRAPRLRSE